MGNTTQQRPPTEPIDAIEVEAGGVLATISKAEIDLQISTAKQFPRSLDKFQRDALTLATVDEETARSCYYVVPRDGGNVEGPSVRLAEIAASCWGNMHAGSRVVDIDERYVTGQALAWDLEKNVRIGVEVKRRITTKYGKRYSDDMIVTTANAAMSIAFRNAVFKVVPRGIYKRVLDEAKKVSLGKGMTMPQRQERALKVMGELGISDKEILKVCKRRTVGDLDVDDLITLNGYYTAIKDGDTTWQEIFAQATEGTSAGLRTTLEGVAEHIPDNQPANKAETAKPPADDPVVNAEHIEDMERLWKQFGGKKAKLYAWIQDEFHCDIEDLKLSQMASMSGRIPEKAKTA